MYYSDLRFILNMFVCHVLIKHIKNKLLRSEELIMLFYVSNHQD
jgi:hypothetical protein